MGIFIILGLLLIASIITYLLTKDSWDWESLCAFSVIILFVASLGIIVCGIVIGILNLNADIDYTNMVEKRDAILYRLEQIDSNENLLVNGGVYDDIIDYNSTVRSYKKYGGDNFWTGWFNPAPINELEYIELRPGKE